MLNFNLLFLLALSDIPIAIKTNATSACVLKITNYYRTLFLLFFKTSTLMPIKI